MDDPFDLLPGEQIIQGRAVPDVQLIEPSLGVDRLTEAGLKIVGHDHVAPCVNELIYSVGADIAGSAQYQNSHKCDTSC